MKRTIMAIFLISMLILSVSAHEIPDLNRTGSMVIEMHYQGKPISGGSLAIYQVGTIQEDNGDYRFVLTSDFEKSGISLENIQSGDTAKELASVANQKKLTGTIKTIDANGRVGFIDLPLGLYLVKQHKNTPGYYSINPFLVSLPSLQSGEYCYEVDASPKTAPNPRPQNTVIPQTGQSGWSIWIFSAGSLSLGILFICRKLNRKRYR